MINLNIPSAVNQVLNTLTNNGYEAYIVGGAIRDTILNKEVNDFDVSTNCNTSKIKELFSDFRQVNNNGEKHNTISIKINNYIIEVTSFKYKEDEENSLINDLKHRDFTINSIAYYEEIIDPYNGFFDINNKIIRALNPYECFSDDPLRILRAIRFKALYEFSIETNTDNAIHSMYELLNNISKERIKKELDLILTSNIIKDILIEYKDIITFIIKELKPCIGFDQHNKYHKDDVYSHIVEVVSNTRNDPILRMAALLHDIAKPLTFTQDENGVGHFYLHANKGSNMAYDILHSLKYSNNEIEQITYLIKYHDNTINLTKKSITKNLANTPNQNIELFIKLLELKNADSKSHTIINIIDIDNVRNIIDEIINTNQCLKVTDLDVDGFDMKKIGFQNKQIKEVLEYLLNEVIENNIQNYKSALIKEAQKYYLLRFK